MKVTLDDVFRALADPTRREILGLLQRGEASTGEIAKRFMLSRPTISKHLGVLLAAELVERRRDGRNQLYTLHADPMEKAHAWLSRYQRHWHRALADLKRHVEKNA